MLAATMDVVFQYINSSYLPTYSPKIATCVGVDIPESLLLVT